MSARAVILRVAALILLVAFVTAPQLFAFAFAPLTANDAPAIYNQGSLLALTLSHLRIVVLATFASTLMAVALGAGCDFLTPIGHQCNTLVMGPGGYRFGDYARLGLPLSILVIVAGVPLIAFFWPLRPM